MSSADDPNPYLDNPASELPLNFPKPSLSRKNPLYEYDPTIHAPEIEPIEHRIRYDFAKAGLTMKMSLLESYSPYNNDSSSEDPWANSGDLNPKPEALKNAEFSIQDRLEYEEHLFENWDDDSVIEKAPGYLAHRFREIRDSDNPEEGVQNERANRTYWYEQMPWSNLYALFTKDSSLGDLYPSSHRQYSDTGKPVDEAHNKHTNYFEGAILVDNNSDPEKVAEDFDVDPDHVYREEEFNYTHKGDALVRPDEYIEAFPAPVVIGHYANDSEYVLLPWTGGLTCQCHYKHEKPFRVMCKHEAMASMLAGEHGSEYLPLTEGIDVPDRVRRLYDPLAIDWTS
ncbi:hypothetical protein RH831_10915 [Halodesulfurarchaeum sp. HSR-GB]|uniref:hypothetical protein n=1 Tax=Halodesulfurarchaeum sp. HSR-GB TaxID=3074077 RepID=UPI0028627569|nr:hypothetical protein [Halodesulfurarchaeum sp. HSR-GB]MDR5657686.1 hypothetical protein [Halodesulfurarchaeum sp. HSR-GB]